MGDNSRMAEDEAVFRGQLVTIIHSGSKYTRVTHSGLSKNESILVPTSELRDCQRSERLST
jgi:hypothetical protein